MYESSPFLNACERHEHAPARMPSAAMIHRPSSARTAHPVTRPDVERDGGPHRLDHLCASSSKVQR